jgi:DHA1 family bicyclomycin/chloramphenicol resistance-like MFS transporter
MAMNRVWLLAGAVAVGQLANSMILPVLPLLAREFDVTAGSAGLVVTAYFGGFAVIGIVIGPLSDRLGRRPLLLAGLAVLALGSAACALATSFLALLACRLLEAAGAAGTPILSRAIVRDTRQDRDLAGALGLLATTMAVSPVLGPIIGAFLADTLGWRGLFGVLAVLAAFAALAVYAGVAETLAPSTPKGAGATWRQMRLLLARPRFRGGVLFGAAYYFAFGAISTAAPFVLIAHLGLSHVQFGAAFALVGGCFAVGGIAGPRLMQIATQARLLGAAAGLVIAAGLLLLAATMLAATTSRPGTVAVIVLCLGLFGLAFGVALSVGAALTLGEAGEAAGTASSLSGCLQVGAAGLGSLLANLTHRGSAMPLSLVLLLAGLAALGAIRRLDRRSAVEG